MVIILTLAVLFGQEPGRDAATFARRAAEFEASEAALRTAPAGEAGAAAALNWLRALGAVLKAIPVARAAGPHEEWVKRHEALIIYSDPSGEWLIGHDVLERAYAEHAGSAQADAIAWLAAENGLPGECEGYVPCYVNSLNYLYGEYLRRQPRGAHRNEAFEAIDESLRGLVDDLLQRKERADYLSVPEDCGDLIKGTTPLRAAVVGAGGAARETVRMLDRLSALCQKR